MNPMPSLDAIRAEIIACERCPRLRTYCQRIAREKRAAYRDATYWARPVPGSGDPSAHIVIVGLAPAAHGANRTGRNFTGDGTGGSGDFLMTALHANGLANQTFSTGADDGLELYDTWMLAAVRCAPPDNKPTPKEFANCHGHMRNEIDALPNAQVFVALGKLAFDACWKLFKEKQIAPANRPAFKHGASCRLTSGATLIASYHPSRQNTHTGRLTPAMLRAVFRKARHAAEGVGA